MEERLGTLKNLFEFAAYDLSELSCTSINESGSYLLNLNVKDWIDDDNYDLYFIRANEELAGFVIIKRILEEDMYYLNHFFILRKYRGKQVGKQAAIKAFNTYHGNWRVSEFDWNTPAQIFWRKVIKAYTNDEFTENRRKDNKGPAQEFKNYKQ
ncbi:GNAT family N-acetyltransferase [Paenibacillus sp. R14(2021)]|uniref:GNAT family N-acetyltransferase n=1 Tax=Paenibacillus sp. R14(2021) TaxID=2859228 RepID=UPI001C615B04|nr:GNAT family N-acetyltransferase [Paenibacillus sp. R14(2021)]